MKKLLNYFTLFEKLLYICSLILVVGSFMIFKSKDYLTLFSSVVGITSLIFCAKGNPVGQGLMIFFSIVYGIISFACRYYGEMITYMGMTLPMSVVSLIAWLKNPFKGNKSEVKVNKLRRRDVTELLVFTAAVTVLFYFVLKVLKTANLAVSTLSVTTSFLAVFLTAKRSPLFALAYAANDVVLIALWVSAALRQSSYISVVMCFVAFLVNDIYSFINWRRMLKRQSA